MITWSSPISKLSANMACFLSLNSLFGDLPNDMPSLIKNGTSNRLVIKLKNAEIANTIMALPISPKAQKYVTRAEMNMVKPPMSVSRYVFL